MFTLQAPFQPSGDQPQAIAALIQSIESGQKMQGLKGVTGSGKTFTMANVIALPINQHSNRPALVLCNFLGAITKRSPHNSTVPCSLAGQNLLSRQCRRLFCLLLRLLSARSVHFPMRHLHRHANSWGMLPSTKKSTDCGLPPPVISLLAAIPSSLPAFPASTVSACRCVQGNDDSAYRSADGQP